MPDMTPAEAKRMMKRAYQYTETAARHRASADREIDKRTHVVILMRDGGVPIQQIADAVGVTRQTLEKQIAAHRERAPKRRPTQSRIVDRAQVEQEAEAVIGIARSTFNAATGT